MWDKLLERRTVHLRRPGGIATPAGQGRSHELDPPSRPLGAGGCDGRDPAEVARFGVATCIGERLRASYANLIREPVPERFMEVLQRMAEPTERAEDLDDANRILGPRSPSLPLPLG